MSRITFNYNGKERLLYNNSYALIIGVDKYEHKAVTPLKYAENDARAVAACLPGLGFPKENIIIRLSSEHQITRESIHGILDAELNRKIGKDDRFLFYFAGHGVSQDSNGKKRGHLLLPDSEFYGRWPTKQRPYLKKKPGKSLPMANLLEDIESLSAKHKLLLIDACFSGFMMQSRSGLQGQPDLGKKLLQWAEEPVTQVITAGKSGQFTFEKNEYEHGVFTWHLLNGLKGAADANEDGVIAFAELGAYVCDHVSIEKDVEQVPQHGNVTGEGNFFFLYGEKHKPKSSTLLPDKDVTLGKALSDTKEIGVSPKGNRRYQRNYEKGTMYAADSPGSNPPFRVLDSLIGLRYKAMGGINSPLGFPVSDQMDAWSSQYIDWISRGTVQFFEGGNIYNLQRYGAHSVLKGKIKDIFEASENTLIEETGKKRTGGILGFPISEQIELFRGSSKSGLVQQFEFGVIIVWDGEGYVIAGHIHDVFQSIGGWDSELGFPLSNEKPLTSSISGAKGRYQDFENGCILFNEINVAPLVIHGGIFSKWVRNKENYGFPLSAAYQSSQGIEQIFEGGKLISASESPGAIDSHSKPSKGDRTTMSEPVASMKAVNDGRGTKVAFRAFNGNFVTATDRESSPLMTRTNQKGEHRTFSIHNLPNGNVYLQSFDGYYVSAENGGGGKIYITSKEPDDHESFKLVTIDEKRIAVKTYRGYFISPEGSHGELTARALQIRGDVDIFELIRLDG